jgi:hypothetical protein
VGEAQTAGRESLFGLTFNHSIKVEARPERLSSEAGVLLLREIDERLGLTRSLVGKLLDPRNPTLIIHPLSELLRARLCMIAEGWGDQDDADKLRHDPALRVAVSERKGDAPLRARVDSLLPDGLASQPTQSRLVEALSSAHNRRALRDALLDWAARGVVARRGHVFRHVTMDFDSTMLEVFGSQGGTAYNGHYACRGYHPLVALVAETGDWVDGMIRSGEVWTAEGAVEFVQNALARVEKKIGLVAMVRGDAGMVTEPMLSALEQRRNANGNPAPTPYVFRLKSNPRLDALAEPYVKRPAGRPPLEGREWTYELQYQAESWRIPRRVVLVVLERPGDLFLDYFFLVTNISVGQLDGEAVLASYRPRGAMEAHLGELKSTLMPALSCSERQRERPRTDEERARADERDSHCNEATMLLYLLAYNLANQARLLMEDAVPQPVPATTGHVEIPALQGDAAEPSARRGWSLQRLREQVLKAAARFLLGGREVRVVITGAAAELWRCLWRRIERLQPLTG